MSERPFDLPPGIAREILDRIMEASAQGGSRVVNVPPLASLHPEARRLFDERELLEGTGSKDVPRGIAAYGEPGYSIGFGPVRVSREAVEQMDAESWARERAQRAAFVARREAKRARRAQLASRASQNDTTRPDSA